MLRAGGASPGSASGAGPSAHRIMRGAASGGQKDPTKKMIIRPFKVQPKLPENFEDTTWEQLRLAITAVQTKSGINMSREELYRAVEDLCVHKMGARLYERLQEECARHIAAVVGSLENQTTANTLFLSRVDDVWQDHCEHMLTIRSIFLYLDRSYVMQTPSLQPIWEMGLSLFRQNLRQKGALEQKTVRGLLELIERERNGEAVNRTLIRSLVRMLSALGIYKSVFQRPFLEDTERYFAAEGVKKLETMDVVGFLHHVEARLREASDAVSSYLEPSTRRPLIQAIEQRLLAPHVTALIERGFELLMDANRAEDMHRMYSLCSRKEKGVDEMKVAFNAYLRKRGAEIVQEDAREKEMIDDLLAFKAKCDGLLEKAFLRNELFVYSLKDAFEYALNVRQNRPAELLAKYLDGKLKGEKGASDDDIEAVLDRVMVLFRYIGSKDVFEAFYKKDLAKRLLLGRSASSDLEKSMIAKLKAECGATFTTKLEGMFKDMDLSREIMTAYSQHLVQRAALDAGRYNQGLEMIVQVLTTGYWPAYPPMEVVVPPVLEQHMQRFSEYYMAKYQGRRLLWQHALGTCVVKARFPLGTKELSVSLFQALVVLCFSKVDTVSFAEIKAQTNVEDGELRRTLQSLACGKINQRVLQKDPKGKDVDDKDVFHLNKEFSHKLYRIRINTIQLKETVEENEKTHEGVFRDRQLQVDAAIVRIMKVRKKLSHQLLISELLGQLKFPAKPQDLKKRIESLIERDYLERDESNPQIYNYLA